MNQYQDDMPGRCNGCWRIWSKPVVVMRLSKPLLRLVQFRHLGVEYDLAVFTNLTPEHLESHGGFENYKHAKPCSSICG
jgi:UDP-N-acetylmuramoylalanine-D-glutamate ligase